MQLAVGIRVLLLCLTMLQLTQTALLQLKVPLPQKLQLAPSRSLNLTTAAPTLITLPSKQRKS